MRKPEISKIIKNRFGGLGENIVGEG